MVNSKQKGKVGELEAAKFLREVLGVEAKRGVQYKGGEDSPDLLHSLSGVHIEVKRVERLNLAEAFAQSQRDAGENIPILMHRRSRQPWLFTFKAEDVIALLQILKKSNIGVD